MFIMYIAETVLNQHGKKGLSICTQVLNEFSSFYDNQLSLIH